MTAIGSGPPPPLANGLQPLSCLRCARHKVRCDRLNPCSRCNKNDSVCEFPVPKTEKRRRRNVKSSSSTSSSTPTPTSASESNDRLFARLDRYEDMLRALGVDLESIDISNSPRARGGPGPPPGRATAFDASPLNATSVQRRETSDKVANGRLTVYGKRCPYVEGMSLNKAEGGEDFNVGAFQLDSSDDNGEDIVLDTLAGYEQFTGASALALGMPPITFKIEDLFPSQQHVSKLWQLYLENIQPITMILHPPSTSVLLLEAARGHGCASKDAEVLLFAVMTCALMSITDEECVKTLGENRSDLISRYRRGCELALINAEFLMSCNFGVLQAYTVYLCAVSAHLDPRELWSLTGIAKRNAQRISLHQEERVKGLTPFEVEMRRRLWHQIVIHDAMSAQVASLQGPDSNAIYEIRPPTNVNDSDLSPTMKEPAKERVGATDMIFCNLRYKVVKFMGRVHEWKRPRHMSGVHQSSAMDQNYRSERQRLVEDMEKDMELNILRYCDILNPVHVLTATVARLTLCKLHFTMFDASHYEETSNSAAKEDRHVMFCTALRVLEYENNVLSQPTIRRFLWHTHQDFQWSCLIFILQSIKTRPWGEQADKAWEQIRRLYEFWPTYQIQKQKLALHTAIKKATLEAWRARETRASQLGQMVDVPTYITTLRGQEQSRLSEQRTTTHHHALPPSFTQLSKQQTENELLNAATFDQETVNWKDWPSFDMTYADPSAMDYLSSTINTNHEMALPMQKYNHDPNTSPDNILPSPWGKEGAEYW